MPTKHLRVLLPSTNNADHQIEETGGAVIAAPDGNEFFMNLPLDLATVKTALTDFTNGIADPSAPALGLGLRGSRTARLRRKKSPKTK